MENFDVLEEDKRVRESGVDLADMLGDWSKGRVSGWVVLEEYYRVKKGED